VIPATAPRELKGQVLEFKRRRVLECARDLFFEQGYEATTLRDLSSDLHVNKPFLYGLYQNKREILAAVCELGLTEALAALDAALQRDLPTSGKLEAVVRSVTATIIEHRKCFVVYQRDEMSLTPAARRRLDSLRATFERRVEELVMRGYREHVLAAGPQAVTAATAGALLLWVASWYAPDRTSEHDAVEFMVGFFGRATGSMT
jgi:AcrR family transcriptional regulator